MDVLILAAAIAGGTFLIALVLNVSADRREAERSARQREALRRAAQRECGDER
jgi:hypothetical protein